MNDWEIPFYCGRGIIGLRSICSVGEGYDRLREVYARFVGYMIGCVKYMLGWRGI